ncbi:MAG: MarR family winged helix-turn-helix transcriptional regulator [Bacteroidota bacterium]
MANIDNEIIIKIRQIVRSINLESKKIQKEYGVSIPQVLCLSYIREAPNFQTTQKNIRNYLNLNASTVTGIINRLEKKGYIARLPKLGDRRITSITLTVAGQKLLDRLPPLMQEQLMEKISELPQEKVGHINSGLDELINLLNIKGVDASPVLTTEDRINS